MSLGPAMKFWTESGSAYELFLEDSFYRKNGGRLERMHWVKALTPEAAKVVSNWADTDYLSEERLPEPGDRLYIGNWDSWWLSTPVERIEEEKNDEV